MTVAPWLWIVFTLIASVCQTARNAMQRNLISGLGTVGATHVRFLFGLPFALLFLPAIVIASGEALPPLTLSAFLWTAAGGLAQMVATGLMLAAMRERSFVIAIAYTKTEPVQVAILGAVLLADEVTVGIALAILIASLGVIMLSWPGRGSWREAISWRPAALGIGAGGLFALAAVGYRGGIKALDAPSFLVGASVTLTIALAVQAGTLTAFLLARRDGTLGAIFRAWRPSLLAGFTGAFASQLWFFAFAIETAARVRTLALVEILFAQIVSRRLLEERLAAREIAGIALLIIGVVLILRG
ncbi:MAG: DMT family transporter [Alphaproteobacteria bacterium]